MIGSATHGRCRHPHIAGGGTGRVHGTFGHMTTWFTADTHYNHAGILGFTDRPWDDVDAMNTALVAAWTAIVSAHDDVWVLGDFGFSTRSGWPLADIFGMLPGHKHLVVGNHDEKNPKVSRLPWASIHDLTTVRAENRMRAVACHYPLESWKSASRGYLMLHGHTHGNLERRLPHRYDVGVDVQAGYAPVAFNVLWERAATEVYEPTDHHGVER